MKPRILYDNRAGTALEYSATFNSSLAPLAFNGLTYDGWNSTSTADQSISASFFQQAGNINMVGVQGHNLEGAIVELRLFGNVVATHNVVSNDAFVIYHPNALQVASVTLRFINVQRPPAIRNIYAGKVLELERGIFVGHNPIAFADADSYVNNLSDSGQFLGRKLIREGKETSIDVDNLSADWVLDNIPEFLESAKRRGFFWQWNPAQNDDQVAFVWTTSAPTISNTGVGYKANKGRLSLSMNVRGLV